MQHIGLNQFESDEVFDFVFTSVVQAIPPESFEDVIFKPALPHLVAILDEAIYQIPIRIIIYYNCHE